MLSGVSRRGRFSRSMSSVPSELVSEFRRFVPRRLFSWSVLLNLRKGTPPPPIWSERLVLRICLVVVLLCCCESEKWRKIFLFRTPNELNSLKKFSLASLKLEKCATRTRVCIGLEFLPRELIILKKFHYLG